MSGHMHIVLDAFWGSCGKGKVCDWITAQSKITDLISGNMPNAGHTVVRGGKKHIAKVLPSGSFLNPDARVWISGSTGFQVEQLSKECEESSNQIFMSDRAFPVTEEHSRFEKGSLSHIASTMQGSAAALVDKILRGQKNLVTQNQVNHRVNVIPARLWRDKLHDAISNGSGLYEVAQGWGLSIDHGTHYPHCTSRNCSAARAIDDAAIPIDMVGSIIAVCRPYPIRVGNTEDGHSGGWAEDSAEVTWEHVEETSGALTGLAEKERTTVTKRIRRVSTFSYDLLKDCCTHNGVSGIFLNFAQYIDSSIAGKRGRISTQAPTSVRIFVDSIEDYCNTPVIALGTGADSFDVLEA